VFGSVNSSVLFLLLGCGVLFALVRPCDAVGIWGSTLGGIAFWLASFYGSFVYSLTKANGALDGCVCGVLLGKRRFEFFGCCGKREKVQE
jgi:hypothetical protein